MPKDGRAMYVFLCIMSLVFFLLSSSVVPFLRSDPAAPSGDILFCFVCCIPAFVPRKSAVVFALVLGFLSDLFINMPRSFSPVVFVLSVLIASYLYGFFSRIGSLVMAVCALACFVLRAAVDTFAVMAQYEGSTAFGVLAKVTFPALIINFAFAIVISFLLRVIVRKFRISGVN